MVYTSTVVQANLSEVVHSSNRPVCHSSEQQTPSIRVSYPKPKGLEYRYSKHKLDRSHCLCLPSFNSPSQVDPKTQAMSLPDYTNSPRLARDALVLGSSAALNRDPTTTPSVNNITQTVPQLRLRFFHVSVPRLKQAPSTIDGYRTAIVDTLGPAAQHIAHDVELHRLLSSFHRDLPKSSRNLPKWNLSVVLNELTKAPCEPIKDTDLKHLTLKLLSC